MYFPKLFAISLLSLAAATAAFGDDGGPLDCGKRSLAKAVANAHPGDTITFTGVCAGPIVIQVDGLTLKGAGSAIIDGGGQDALTIAGASRASLSNFEVRGGLDGIMATNGAHASFTNLNVHNNFVFGISLQTGSSGILSGVTTTGNGVHGLDLETGSGATITGAFSSTGNQVFGINVNGSALTFSQATANISGNAIGLQVATSGNAFINDSKTTLNFINNQAVGLTVVSGGHMVSFGGTINATGNPLNGVSINSKAGLDLDAGTQLNVSGNGNGVLLQEGSVMTVFNLPQFSGFPGYTVLNTHGNTGAGVQAQANSTLTFSGNAKLMATANMMGVAADDGVTLTLVNSTLTGNSTKDLLMTFGTRADVQTTTVGTYSCDSTVLARGTAGITCPK